MANPQKDPSPEAADQKKRRACDECSKSPKHSQGFSQSLRYLSIFCIFVSDVSGAAAGNAL